MAEVKKIMPRLKNGSCEVIFEFYNDNVLVDSGKIARTFGISANTARVILRNCRDIMRDKGIVIAFDREVPVEVVAEAYGWDMPAISRKVRALRKMYGREAEKE